MTEAGSPERVPPMPDRDPLSAMWKAGLNEKAAIEVKKQMEHLRKLDHQIIRIQLLSIVFGFLSLLTLATLSCIFVLQGYPAQGAIVIGAGGLTVVGMFLGTRSATLSIQERVRGISITRRSRKDQDPN